MHKKKIVLIGASTGGPGHLRKILLSLPEHIDYALVICQHMNLDVIDSFAKQMQENCSLNVLLANHKEVVKVGNIYICSSSMEFIVQNSNPYLISSNQKDIYCPSINTLFASAICLVANTHTTAILLTGIGDDGAEGLVSLYKHGAFCIAESQESAIVYGMPKQAYLLNKKVNVMNLNKIVEYLEDV